MGEKKATESLPDVGQLKYLLDCFFEMGICEGDQPISWQEIESWQRLTFTPLELWEAKLLKKLSNAYVQSIRLYQDTFLPSPMDETKQAGADLDNRIKNALRIVGNRK